MNRLNLKTQFYVFKYLPNVFLIEFYNVPKEKLQSRNPLNLESKSNSSYF